MQREREREREREEIRKLERLFYLWKGEQEKPSSVPMGEITAWLSWWLLMYYYMEMDHKENDFQGTVSDGKSSLTGFF
jgi:hypothetical protein